MQYQPSVTMTNVTFHPDGFSKASRSTTSTRRSSMDTASSTMESCATPMVSNRKNPAKEESKKSRKNKEQPSCLSWSLHKRTGSRSNSGKRKIRKSSSMDAAGLMMSTAAPMIYIFKGRGTSSSPTSQKYLKDDSEDHSNMLNSLESVTSVISAITLCDELASVPEADPGSKFESGVPSSQQKRDSVPRIPRRRSDSDLD